MALYKPESAFIAWTFDTRKLREGEHLWGRKYWGIETSSTEGSLVHSGLGDPTWCCPLVGPGQFTPLSLAKQ